MLRKGLFAVSAIVFLLVGCSTRVEKKNPTRVEVSVQVLPKQVTYPSKTLIWKQGTTVSGGSYNGELSFREGGKDEWMVSFGGMRRKILLVELSKPLLTSLTEIERESLYEAIAGHSVIAEKNVSGAFNFIKLVP